MGQLHELFSCDVTDLSAAGTSCTCLGRFPRTSPAASAWCDRAGTEPSAKRTTGALLHRRHWDCLLWDCTYLGGAVVIDTVLVSGLFDPFRDAFNKLLDLLQLENEQFYHTWQCWFITHAVRNHDTLSVSQVQRLIRKYDHVLKFGLWKTSDITLTFRH